MDSVWNDVAEAVDLLPDLFLPKRTFYLGSLSASGRAAGEFMGCGSGLSETARLAVAAQPWFLETL